MSLTFNPETHEYQWNGVVVPSVTQIIGAWRKVTWGYNTFYVNTFTGAVMDSDTMENAAWYGREIHAAARLALLGRLDWDALDPELFPPLHQLLNWQDMFGVEVLLAEQPLYHKLYGFAGTPDLKCILTKNVRRPRVVVVDFKTGGYEHAGVQLAAYQELLKVNGHMDVTHRYVLILKRDGAPFQFIEQKKQSDWNTFNACLVRHREMVEVKK